MALVNSTRIIVTSDPALIEALWMNEEAVLLGRHCDKHGVPISEEWIVPQGTLLGAGAGLKIGEKTA